MRPLAEVKASVIRQVERGQAMIVVVTSSQAFGAIGNADLRQLTLCI
ncbi:MAG: hypothetical protein ABI667_03255 [Sphingomicrobium sp.]